MASFQDWDKVVLGEKKPKQSRPSTAGAGPSGENADTEKKFAAGSNAKRTDNNMAKLDNETEAYSHQKVGMSLGKAIQKARVAKKMTQANLAQVINEKPAVINQYENGKAIPNGLLISKIERALAVKLPRPAKK